MAHTEEVPAPPQPTAEHAKLAEHAGTWNVDCSFYMDPSQPPMKVEATETIEMFGPFFTVSTFTATMFGQPFQGRSTLGYDPYLGHYESSWIDTMTPAFYHFTGAFDESGTVLEMSGQGTDCYSKQQATYVTREEHRSPDERVFEMFQKMPDGQLVKMFTHVYRRAR